MILISACLAGEKCRYNGDAKPDSRILKMIEERECVLICPECRLATPRPPAEISGGTGKDVLEGRARVILQDGADVTAEYIAGAYETLEMARAWRAERIYMTQNSPSCGCGSVYDGTFSGTKIAGNGVAAQLLIDNGFDVRPVIPDGMIDIKSEEGDGPDE